MEQGESAATTAADGQNAISSGPAGATDDTRSVQAQRFMRKLDECDQTLALLLTQAADSLESIMEQSKPGGEAIDLSAFEDVSQDWLANIYDTQLTLRKVIRFLVRSNQPPIMTAPRAFVHGGGVSAATAGSAARVKSHLDDDEKQQESAEATLSMSALRLKRQAWKDTLESLQQLEASRKAR